MIALAVYQEVRVLCHTSGGVRLEEWRFALTSWYTTTVGGRLSDILNR